MASPSETGSEHDSTLSVEQRVINILTGVRQVLGEGQDRFGTLALNPKKAELEGAVGQLGTEDLAKLVVGGPVDDIDVKEDAGIKYIGGLWSAEERARKLSEIASARYLAAQNGAISELLEGRLMTASRKENASNFVLSGVTYTGDPTNAPDTVNGMFAAVDVSDGTLTLMLQADGTETTLEHPYTTVEQWQVRPLGSQGLKQQVLLDISDTA